MKQHHDKLLITFGCSWTLGVGCNYEEGMSKSAYLKHAWNRNLCDTLSFRGVLSQKLGSDNLDFSIGGGSNQSQFRLAENLFGSPTFLRYQEMYSSITVLWGITSVLRGEFYCRDTDRRENILFTSSDRLLSKCILCDHLDIDHEVSLLAHKMRFWNDWFAGHSVKNWWFDTFNHHEYVSPRHSERDYPELVNSYKMCRGRSWPTWGPEVHDEFNQCDQDIRNEILDHKRWDFYRLFPTLHRFVWHDVQPRDLMSQLAQRNGFSMPCDAYHASDWLDDCERVRFLLSAKLINPFTKHPTRRAHNLIADWLEPYIKP